MSTLVVLLAARQLAVLARRRVELELRGVAALADEPHRALDLAREHELGDHRLERDALLEHHLHEGAVDVGERGRERLLDREVEHRLLHRGELDRALAEPADGLGHRERARLRLAGHVAVHADRGDEPDALLVAAAHLGAEHPRRDHADVAGRVEAVERERVAAGDDREPGRRAAAAGATG